MKIINLSFRNINNLKGDHTISFEQFPLSTASIFAIVGPTGSGKSTILDAITLALFNRIPRFSKAISKNEITKEASVLTHHTREASASIEYEIKGQRYKSTWSISTNRNDKLKDYEMTFYNADGTVEDLKKSEVPAKNEEIIGLKYDQFVKAILLSQGEFAKFLKADKNERGALLENLTGTSIYRKIGLKAYQKYKSVKEALEKEKDLLGENTSLDEETRRLLEEELKSSQKAKLELDKELASLTQLLNIKTEKLRLAEALQNKLTELSAIQSQVQLFESDKSRLTKHHKLSHLQGPFTTYKNSLDNADISRTNLEGYKKDLSNYEKELEFTIQEMAKLTKEKVNNKNFKVVMSTFEAEVTNLDKDLEHVRKNGTQTRERITNQSEGYPLVISSKASEALIILEKRATELNNQIARTKLDVSQPLSELRTLLTKEQEKLDKLRVIENHTTNIEGHNNTIQTESQKLEEYKKEIETLQPLIAKSQTLLESIHDQIGLLRKQKEDAIKIAKLEQFRDNLQKGEACPLCGSLDHPYSEHLPQQKNTIDQKIKDTEDKSKIIQKELQDSNGQLTSSQKAIEIIDKQLKETKIKLKEEELIISNETSALNLDSNTDSNSIKQLVESQKILVQNEKEAIEALTELEQNKRLHSSYTELQNIGIEYKTIKKNREEKFQGDTVTDVTNKLQDDFQNYDGKINQLIAVIEKESKSLKRDEELVISIANDLEPKIAKLGFSNINEIASHLLDETTLNTLTGKEESLNATNIKVNTEIESLKANLQEKENQDADKSLALEDLQEKLSAKKRIAEEHNEKAITNQEKLKRDDADRAKIKEREKTISKLNKEYDKWSLLNSMIGDATGNKFSNFAQGLTLQNLLVYANRRLTNLTDRYLLSKPKEDGSLIVIDKYQGDSPRSVKTLSGGETFLISLALALSLSDMASKNVALGCLFIDEGFGTLDQDTLELAMTTLEALQSDSQKTVGIISHVEGLKERIRVQIKLNKNAQGYSKIEIKSADD